MHIKGLAMAIAIEGEYLEREWTTAGVASTYYLFAGCIEAIFRKPWHVPRALLRRERPREC